MDCGPLENGMEIVTEIRLGAQKGTDDPVISIVVSLFALKG